MEIQNLKADIVVLGGGGAGLTAAVAAAEAGAKNIIVLEKAPSPGGNARTAGGFFAAESPAQKRLGINVSKDELFKEHMEYSHWRSNPRLVRAFINKSGDIVRWLEEKGLKFNHVAAILPGAPRVAHALDKGPSGKAGSRVIATLIKDCEERGVQLLCDTVAKKIITDKKGKATGVVAATKDKELRLTAKSVIIATGGFAGNKELLKKYFPSYNENVFTHSLPQMTGDGLLMATEAGAATDNLIAFVLFSPHHYPWNSHITLLTRRPNVMWVNKNGERYADESIFFRFSSEAGNVLGRQPDNLSYTLLDEKIKRDMIIKRENIGGFEESIGDGGAWFDSLENDIQSEIDEGRIKKSDSWDGIAEWIGAAPAVLKTSVEQYNSFCNKGYDADFLKDKRFLLPLHTPPYYAILGRQGFDVSMGGIRINHRMEVMNKQGSPIGGLYAAGNDAGGWEGDTYDFRFPGGAFSFCLCSGYIAGENAAKYVLADEG